MGLLSAWSQMEKSAVGVTASDICRLNLQISDD